MKQYYTPNEVKAILKTVLKEEKRVEDMDMYDHIRGVGKHRRQHLIWHTAEKIARRTKNPFLAGIYKQRKAFHKRLINSHKNLQNAKFDMSSFLPSYSGNELARLDDTHNDQLDTLRYHKELTDQDIRRRGLTWQHNAIVKEAKRRVKLKGS